MMSYKATTKAYSPAPQTSALKAGKDKNLDARAENKALQGKDLGTFLNQVADPNYVDPIKTRKVGGDELGKDAFMKLMLAQFKNQDPTNPLQSHEMAAQLAQFSQVEQLNNLNSTLSGMAESQKPVGDYQALNFIGKTVSVDTGKIIRSKGDTNHDLRFQIPDDAASLKIVIKDLEGKVIKNIEQQDVAKGTHTFSWSGNTENADLSPAGEYKFSVEAVNGAGKKLAVATAFKGRISGVNYTNQGPVLLVGDQSFKMSDIQKIEDSEIKSDIKATESASQAPKPTMAAASNVAPQSVQPVMNGAKEVAPSQLDSIPMSSGLKNKIAEEVSDSDIAKGEARGGD
jgi:flagellar basal-body rod modification protein FlgD